MYKRYRNNIKNSTPVVLTIMVLVFSTFIIMSNTSNANAIDFSNFNTVDTIGQSLHCVIVVIGCNGTGSVESSGNTIIGSNNGNNDTNNGNELET